MIWRAWYKNATYSSREMSWTALPATGLVVAVTYVEAGKCIHGGGDWYQLVNGAIAMVPSPAAWGTWALKPRGCKNCIKQGVGVSDDEYQRLDALAFNSVAP